MLLTRFLLVLLSVVVFSGCIEIRENLLVRMDGSGKLQVAITFPQFGLKWLPGKPAAEWLEFGMPDGVRLTSFKNEQSKFTLTGADGKEHELDTEVVNYELDFDAIEALNDVRVTPDDRNVVSAEAGGTPGMQESKSMADTAGDRQVGPFQGIEFNQEGRLIQFRRVIQVARNSDEIQADSMNVPGSEMKPEVFDLGESSWVITIECPGEVITHNATSADGRRLTWDFSLQTLQEQQDRDWTVEFTCRKENP